MLALLTSSMIPLKVINMSRVRTVLYLLPALMLCLIPFVSEAHEVYLLTPEEIATLTAAEPVSFFSIFAKYISATIWSGLVVGFLMVSIFVISISATLENKLDAHLIKLKHFAPFIARVTVGLAFLTCAYHAALFGPELPFTQMFGSYTPLAQIAFATLGGFMIFGIYARSAGIAGLIIFLIGITYHGVYMVTYLNYLTEFIVLILVGGHKFAIADERPVTFDLHHILDYLSAKYGEFAFLILRVGFGASLIYSSLYAKVIHNQLGLAVATNYGLAPIFGVQPEFLLFGAAIVEILLGVMFILGIEIRFNAIVINIFLTLSLLYFGEAVWPHIILIGIPIAFFCYGYDKYSLEGYFFKKGNREPIF